MSCRDCVQSEVPQLFFYIHLEEQHWWAPHGAKHNPGHTINNESAIKNPTEIADHNIYPKDAQILQQGGQQLQQEAFPGVMALHFRQQYCKRKERVPSHVCSLNSKLRTLPAMYELVAQTTTNFAQATTNFFVLHSD